MRIKSCLSTRRKWQLSSLKMMVAARGASFSKASCPKSSPSCSVVTRPCMHTVLSELHYTSIQFQGNETFHDNSEIYYYYYCNQKMDLPSHVWSHLQNLSRWCTKMCLCPPDWTLHHEKRQSAPTFTHGHLHMHRICVNNLRNCLKIKFTWHNGLYYVCMTFIVMTTWEKVEIKRAKKDLWWTDCPQWSNESIMIWECLNIPDVLHGLEGLFLKGLLCTGGC